MNVAYVISTLDAGGAERMLVNLVNALPERVVPHVFVLRNQMAIAPLLTNPRATIHVIGLESRLDMRGWLKLARELRRVRPDVIHSQMFLSNSVCRILKPVSGARALVNHEHGLSGWKSLPLRYADRFSQGLADRIVVVSEASRRVRMIRFGIDNSRIAVIPNALDWSYWSALRPERRNGATTRWGIAARLIPIKRVGLAVELLAKAKAAGASCELWIAGDGPDRERLEEMCVLLGIAGAVRFLGHVDDMRCFYSDIDVLLLTSASEDCPMSLLEGLASGRFVGATKVGGVPEILEGAPDSLVIDELEDLAVPARRLGEVEAGFDSDGNRDYCRRYDIHLYVEHMMGLYEEVLGQ